MLIMYGLGLICGWSLRAIEIRSWGRLRAYPSTEVARRPWQSIPLSPSCISAQDIARAIHYPSDWRDLRVRIDRLNPGLDWGHLQPGQRIRVPTGGRAGYPAEQYSPQPARPLPLSSRGAEIPSWGRSATCPSPSLRPHPGVAGRRTYVSDASSGRKPAETVV